MITSSSIEELNPYVPGEQPKDRVYIKLNANENPYKPSKKVQKEIISFVKKQSKKLAVYPDPDSNELHAAIADMLNASGGVLCRTKVNGKSVEPSDEDKIPFTVTPDMIYTGNGSDEVLSFVFYAFFDSSKKFVMPQYTYSFYPVYAGYYDIPMDQVPLKEDWSLDTEEMLKRADANKSGIIFANPNAPTGIGLKRAEVKAMLDKASKDEIFIVDEAYVDFGGESCIPLLKDYKNLVIVTTVKNSVNHFPLDAVAQVAGKAACGDVAYYADCAKKVAFERDKFYEFLKSKGFYVIKSETNFLFAKKDGVAGEDLYKKIKAEGLLIRHFNTPGIEDFVRITIGTAEEMTALRNAFEKVL